MMDLVVRFLVGGTVITVFAILGDVFKPKSFAGLFGAAPSVALATLGLAFADHGGQYVSAEGRSMMAGAVGLFAYCRVLVWLTGRRNLPALAGALLSLPAWFGVAFGVFLLLPEGRVP